MDHLVKKKKRTQKNGFNMCHNTISPENKRWMDDAEKSCLVVGFGIQSAECCNSATQVLAD